VTAVKLCGLTREEDVRAAIGLGVDFLGFNFVPESPRCLTLERAMVLVGVAHAEAAERRLPLPRLVGVFAPPGDALEETVRLCRLDYVQWHGPLEALMSQSLPLIQALRPAPGEAPPETLPGRPWAYLLDAYHHRLLGGTGRRADWEVGAALARRCRLFLAGGLDPANVGRAVLAVKPFAVDVASGIEVSPGIKDHQLMQAFVEEVRKADATK